MKILFELSGSVFTSIKPRNERARIWQDKLIKLCDEGSEGELTQLAHRAAVESIRDDFTLLMVYQGPDPEQRNLYAQAEHLVKQLEASVQIHRNLGTGRLE